MKKTTLILSTIALLVLCSTVFAAGIDGTWESERQGRQGNTMKTTYVFKSDKDGNLTGTVSSPMGGEDTAITEGKVEGDNVSFTVVRSFNNNEMKMKYKGTVSGDELKLTFEMEGGFGGRGGGQGAPGGMAGPPPQGGQGGPQGGRGRAPREIIAKRVKK